ncbi:laccase-1 [Fopius arisanus]|uniref:LCC4 protein n=2 Tax=Fopius arisanus TaxID=64838 RepID=A0A0C9R4T4_9HYME|nr:PREDICTED: laccase-1-like [Fopius arisanus]XP_011300939.1 PREDICTED: laccase-1-like [Fopius arisanus]
MIKWRILSLSVIALNFFTEASILINIDNEHLDMENEKYVDMMSHPCRRPCKDNSPPMICQYSFQVEHYSTMSKSCWDCPKNLTHCFLPQCIPADGFRRSITVVNRQLPGPGIEICQGDRLIVDVINSLTTESTSMHWHGQHHRASPYMDGVPYVTQCPIHPGSTFRYHYTAATSGTHLWHSHSGMQRGDGVFGALIVRPPESRDHHRDLYDVDEHMIVVVDWDHIIGHDKFLDHHHAFGDNKPPNMLINGFGPYDSNHIDTNIPQGMPFADFTVKQGERHRFRLINAGFLNCPIEISMDNHTMYIISTDGNDIDPVKASSLVTYAGERFDFIVSMNQRVDNYWIRFRGLMDCDERFMNVRQRAILRYEGAPNEEPMENKYWMNFEHDKNDNDEPAMQVNGLNKGTESSDTVSIPLLKSLEPDDESNLRDPDQTFYLGYDFYNKSNLHYQVEGHPQVLLTPQINHISMKFPEFPLLPQRDSMTTENFCNSSTVGDCKNKYCECTHVIQVALGNVIELVLVDEGVAFDANHPFHLHGNSFRVVAMTRVGKFVTVDEIKELDRNGSIVRRLESAPLKDTVTVPDGGYTIVRFYADNPGYWIFHCHIDFHVEIGMALVFKVGNNDEMPAVPVGFPSCGNYQPRDPPEMITKNTTSPHKENVEDTPLEEININLQNLGALSSSSHRPYSFRLKILSVIFVIVLTVF